MSQMSQDTEGFESREREHVDFNRVGQLLGVPEAPPPPHDCFDFK